MSSRRRPVHERLSLGAGAYGRLGLRQEHHRRTPRRPPRLAVPRRRLLPSAGEHRGTPLTDVDRAPWLAAIAAWIDERLAAGKPGIVSCSALKRAYRDAIVGGRKGARLVYLKGEKALIAKRVAARLDHFMPPALLDSQFATLEEPAADERPLVVPVSPQPGEVVEFIVSKLGLSSMSPAGRP
jgi:gluconokinase